MDRVHATRSKNVCVLGRANAGHSKEVVRLELVPPSYTVPGLEPGT
jgi:hypothetical protein